jgi:rubredoxin-NAD+ reductase
MRSAQPLVIVGSGMAGYGLLREFRKRDPAAPVILVTDDDGRVYIKPNLSNALAQGRTPEQLASETAAQAAQRYRARILTGARVTAIRREEGCVVAAGESLPYDRLVLALGADPIPHGLLGDAADRVLAVNDLADYGRFRAALAEARRVAILGGGLIGCEFANDLAARGYAVAVVHRGAWPLDRLVPEPVGRAVAAALAEKGVAWHFGRSARTADPAAGIALALDDGSRVEADLALSAIGLRPRTALAGAAGLAVERGIVADRQLRSSDARIHALGDCAQVEGLVLPYVQPLMAQARTLAAVLAGDGGRLAYPAMPVLVKTPACPLLVAPPPVGVAGEWRVEGNGRDLCALFHEPDGRLRGFALTGGQLARRDELVGRLPALLA